MCSQRQPALVVLMAVCRVLYLVGWTRVARTTPKLQMVVVLPVVISFNLAQLLVYHEGATIF